MFASALFWNEVILVVKRLDKVETEEKRQAEWETIKTIARNNNYTIKCITRIKTQLQNKTPTPNARDNNKKWATFTYRSSNVRKITNLFKQTDVNIAFRGANTIRQYTRPNSPVKTHDYNNSGIYKLTCMSCNKSYIGQTSRIQHRDTANTSVTSEIMILNPPLPCISYETHTNTGLSQIR
jgi:hypothetical protein